MISVPGKGTRILEHVEIDTGDLLNGKLERDRVSTDQWRGHSSRAALLTLFFIIIIIHIALMVLLHDIHALEQAVYQGSPSTSAGSRSRDDHSYEVRARHY